MCGAQVVGQLLHHGVLPDLIVPPLLHDHVLQALELQDVMLLLGEQQLQSVRLLPDPDLPSDFELPFAEAAPGGKALRVPPVQLLVPAAHVVPGVAHDHLRRERTVPVEAVHYPAFLPLADIAEEVVLDLSPVQMDHLEVPDVHGPVGVLSRGHELQQVPRSALVQETLRSVRGGPAAPLEHALLPVEYGALHLVLRVEGLLLVVRRPAVGGVPVHVLVLVVVVVRENVGDANARSFVLRVEAMRVRRWHLCVT